MEKRTLYHCDLGFLEIVMRDRMLAEIVFLDRPGNHKSDPIEDSMRQVIQELDEYFAGQRITFSMKVKLTGTPFEQKVYEALQNIPYGETRSYKEIAEQIGHPKAFRAVGSANRKNPVPIVVPCHRVIGANGKLAGYNGGIEKKIKLLAIEGINA